MQQSLFGMLATTEAPASGGATSVYTPPVPQAITPKTPIDEVVFTVLDLETTGLNSKRNAITEVTAIQFKNDGAFGQEIAKFSTFIKPSQPIPEEIEHFTGITNDMVKSAPALIEVMSQLASFVGPSPVIVGHNVPFDIGFLQDKLDETGLHVFQDRFLLERALCSRILGKKAIPGLPSYEGITVATAVGYHNPNPHRAEADVRMSGAILFGIINRLNQSDTTIRTLADLWAYQGPLKF